ncbi:unnamed protein product, partial [Brassica rapa]
MELTERVEVREPTVNEPGVLEGWVLCEIGMDWSKTGDIMGAAWITKNCRGKVLEHSRRAFSRSKTVGNDVGYRKHEESKEKEGAVCIDLWRLGGGN